MIEIGRLRLQLPAGFENRGARIARLVGDALGRQSVARPRQHTNLHVGPLNIDPGQSDARVARDIARAIGRQLARGE